MTTSSSRTMAVGMALLLVLSVLAPTVAAAETTVTLETDPATEVTDRSATLNGNLTGLSGAENATVYFEYWAADDPENSTNTTGMNVGNGTFSWEVSGLSNDTGYVYVAHAEADGTNATGDERTFTTLAQPPLAVDTTAASGVTPTSATLNGELTGMGDSGNATVRFEYWIEGERNGSTTTAEVEVDSTGAFDANASGLAYNETYVYVAHAETDGSNATGDRVTFTTGLTEENREDQPFGHWVSAFVHSLLDSEDSGERNLGQMVSEFVTENNPGADNRPEDAGPPEDRGDDDDGEDDDERGPPEDRGNDKDEDGDERGPPEDAGPPEDRGNNDDEGDDDDGDEDDDDDEDEDDDDDERGPPEGAGNGNGRA